MCARTNEFSNFQKISVEEDKTNRILVEKVEKYLCGVEQTECFKEMSVEMVEKIESYRILVEKIETYLTWVEQSRTLFC